MSTYYKLMLAISAACVIGPGAFVLWLLYELTKVPDIFEVRGSFEEMAE